MANIDNRASILIFDADNTLWDTNAVFRSAQLAMLSVLQDAGLVDDPEAAFAALRRIDQGLVERLDRAEYDFTLLAAALVHFYCKQSSIDEAVNAAINGTIICPNCDVKAIVARARDAFVIGLETVPPLLPGVEEILAKIQTSQIDRKKIAMVILTEGNSDRLSRIVIHHRSMLGQLADEVLIASKEPSALAHAKAVGLRLLGANADNQEPTVIMVGDSIHRDIKLGNQAGFVTVYVPAGYKGHEIPQSDDERPAYTVPNLQYLPAVLQDLGVFP